MSEKEQLKVAWLQILEQQLAEMKLQTALLREIRDLLKPKKSPPKHAPPPPHPVEDPGPKRKLVFNEAINKWQWENDK